MSLPSNQEHQYPVGAVFSVWTFTYAAQFGSNSLPSFLVDSACGYFAVSLFFIFPLDDGSNNIMLCNAFRSFPPLNLPGKATASTSSDPSSLSIIILNIIATTLFVDTCDCDNTFNMFSLPPQKAPKLCQIQNNSSPCWIAYK